MFVLISGGSQFILSSEEAWRLLAGLDKTTRVVRERIVISADYHGPFEIICPLGYRKSDLESLGLVA